MYSVPTNIITILYPIFIQVSYKWWQVWIGFTQCRVFNWNRLWVRFYFPLCEHNISDLHQPTWSTHRPTRSTHRSITANASTNMIKASANTVNSSTNTVNTSATRSNTINTPAKLNNTSIDHSLIYKLYVFIFIIPDCYYIIITVFIKKFI